MVFDKILRLGEGRTARELQKVVVAVSALGPDLETSSDDQLRAKTAEFKQRLAAGETLDDLQVEVFAVVREAAWRTLAQRPFDVQVFGAATLHAGMIAEMRTGEGKTLTSTMPVYLNALTGRGVHVVTVNEYLARRDADWMGKVHRFLGLSVGVVHSQQPRDDKQRAYAADITYGTNNEFGFDYLRDNMAWQRADQVQRGHFFALVDEVDSILVDEARTPLIISGPAEQSSTTYQTFARTVAPNLSRGEEGDRPGEATGDYVVDEAKRTVAVTEQGVAKVEQLLAIDNMYESVNTPLVLHLQNALKAKDLFKRDREYIVDDGEVKIVDENTGRVLEGRRYSEGLHQAIEAKEGVRIKEENQTLATITLQNYYRTYDKLAGMTGTAKTEELELREIYELGVVVVPTNRPMIRDDESDLIYKSAVSKFAAVVDDIAQRHERGQPVLVGTTSVERSEYLSGLLKKRGIRHEVLNAKNHAREAHIVAQAGRAGAVTVSTNMAGRGTDIVLGGNPEELATDEAARLGPDATDDERDQALTAAVERYAATCRDEQRQVLDAGGLYVIGTERHESRRIDNQLRGRSGRQGDPGESRFYLSLEDDLMRLFNAAAVERIMTRLRIPEDVPIEHKWVTRAVANAQRQVESRNFDIRKNVLKYDDVMNEQRKVVYKERQKLLEGDAEAVSDLAQRYIDETVEGVADEFAGEQIFPEEWQIDTLANHVAQIYDTSFDFGAVDLETVTHGELTEALLADAFDAYDRREEEVGGDEVMREVERRVILSVADRKWREHLHEMDALRDGIGLRAVGQRDPLVEYQREAYDSFMALLQGVKEEAVTYFFRLPVHREDEGEGDGRRSAPVGDGVTQTTGSNGSGAPASTGDGHARRPAAAATQLGGAPQRAPQRLSYSSSATDGTAAGGGGRVAQRDDGTTVRQIAAGGTYTADDKVGRNDPCPCGSGQKYKRCHGA